MKFVIFEGDKLMHGSDAYGLYHDNADKGHEKLRAHMRDVTKRWKQVEGRK